MDVLKSFQSILHMLYENGILINFSKNISNALESWMLYRCLSVLKPCTYLYHANFDKLIKE